MPNAKCQPRTGFVLTYERDSRKQNKRENFTEEPELGKDAKEA